MKIRFDVKEKGLKKFSDLPVGAVFVTRMGGSVRIKMGSHSYLYMESGDAPVVHTTRTATISDDSLVLHVDAEIVIKGYMN